MKRLSHEATPERRGRVIFPLHHRLLPCVNCFAYRTFNGFVALSFAFPPFFVTFVVACVFLFFIFCASVGRLDLQYPSSLSLRVFFAVLSPCWAILRIWFPYILV